MARVLPVIVLLAITIYAVVDLVQTDEFDVPGMPKWMWALLVVLVPAAGPIAWILVGRFGVGVPPLPPDRAPDDDEEWLNKL
ncbi:PLD nuclease N-terminal domain-containing protein [Propionibacterium sp.]|uniref:PLD nuclease N-terminal domain-containing protein n=1 Tax=Propionibacterium sp. TaxID=1977903 RepID=UPI0039EAC5F9